MLYRAIPKRGPGGGGGSSVVRGKTTSWIVVGTTAFLVLCLLLSIDSRLAARLDRDKAAAAAAGKAHVNTSSKPATSSLFALPSISEAKPPQPSPSSKSADAGLAKAASAAKDSKQTSSPLLSSSVYKLLPQSKDQSTWDIYEQTLADFITSSLPEHGGLRRRALAALQREGHRKRSGQRTGDELEGKAIPEIIWQTRPRRQVAPGAGSDNAYDDNDFRGDSFSLLNPTWKRFVLDDDQLEAWVKSQLGEKTSSLYETWHSIRDNGIAKADVFRYLAMALEGGVYSDIDTVCLRPIPEWGTKNSYPDAQYPPTSASTTNTPKLLIAIESDGVDDPNWARSFVRPLQLVQWTMASRPMHPIFLDALRRVQQNLAASSPASSKTGGTGAIGKGRQQDRDVLESTGPAVLTDAVFQYLLARFEIDAGSRLHAHVHSEHGRRPLRIADELVILPITAFSPNVPTRPGSGVEIGNMKDEQALVYHSFSGSWRKE